MASAVKLHRPYVPKASSSKPKIPKSQRPKVNRKVLKTKFEDEITALEEEVEKLNPASTFERFTDLPLTEPTRKGLKSAGFDRMTDIQAESLPYSLKGRDVLGAARTGSGKTLAFLIPVLEILHRRRWGPMDGLGALIISPTRELALQIFDVLRSIGSSHMLSAGLVIGGKNVEDEKAKVSRMNILVATPGRLLQHLDQTVSFDYSNLQVLVLDEADRILDMGFSKTINAIVQHLPKSRQTLLFSATQTQSIKDLARLSLQDLQHVGVQEDNSKVATPKNLEHHYTICTLDQKLDFLYSFIRTHLFVKTLVFLSSCKQVRFVFETFSKLRPGISLLHIHGKQKQMKRLEIYNRFVQSQASVLFATDIASRGLDFPAVDWVVQTDAPESAQTYIHRVGRTARYQSKGQGLLFLLPSEEAGTIASLKEKNVLANKIKIKDTQTLSIQTQLQKYCFEDPEIKYLGQKAFVSYLKSLYLLRNKGVFKLEDLPLDKFAESMGLPGTPKVKFVTKEIAQRKKNASRGAAASAAPQKEQQMDDSSSSGEDQVDDQPIAGPGALPKVRTKYDKMFERKNRSVLTEHYNKLVDHGADVEDPAAEEDDFITLKRVDHALDDIPTSAMKDEDLSKRKLRIGASKKLMAKYKGLGTKSVFDNEGNAHGVYDFQALTKDEAQLMEEARRFVEKERELLQEADVEDREVAKGKKREKKRKRKEREREEAGLDADDTSTALGPVDAADDSGYESPNFGLPSLDGSYDDLPPHGGPPPPKRSRIAEVSESRRSDPGRMLEDEELALRLLHGS